MTTNRLLSTFKSSKSVSLVFGKNVTKDKEEFHWSRFRQEFCGKFQKFGAEYRKKAGDKQ